MVTGHAAAHLSPEGGRPQGTLGAQQAASAVLTRQGLLTENENVTVASEVLMDGLFMVKFMGVGSVTVKPP